MFDLTNPKTWSVLVVDDEPDNVEVTAEVLTFLGVTVRTAANGEEGLEVLRNFTPDLILLDLSMPKMDGWVMRHQIKANPLTTHIPILALSAHAMAGDKQRALDAGFDGYLTKPIYIACLLDDIRAELHKKSEGAG
ncbi:MAG TPA: response regulator [Anaerolineales bacterium]|nr:response regulator [Anaerolineales bacterium]HEX3051348.1 response regulator [Aggregatilineaceae bacterium]